MLGFNRLYSFAVAAALVLPGSAACQQGAQATSTAEAVLANRRGHGHHHLHLALHIIRLRQSRKDVRKLLVHPP